MTLSNKGKSIGGIKVYVNRDIKEFIKKRKMDLTKILGMFNAGTLTSEEIRLCRIALEEEAGAELI